MDLRANFCLFIYIYFILFILTPPPQEGGVGQRMAKRGHPTPKAVEIFLGFWPNPIGFEPFWPEWRGYELVLEMEVVFEKSPSGFLVVESDPPSSQGGDRGGLVPVLSQTSSHSGSIFRR